MVIIGEKLNSSVKQTRLMMQQRDAQAVEDLARRQVEAGADYLDVNTSMFMDDEAETLIWTLRTILAVSDGKIALDSADHQVLRKALQAVPLRDVILNSVTLEKERYAGFLPLALEYGAGIVALPVSDDGVPETAEERGESAVRLAEALIRDGVPPSGIYVDCLVETAAAGDGPGKALGTIALVGQARLGVHILCGLSNVSYGLPGREWLNMAFLSAAVYCGADAFIMDIANENMRRMLAAARVIAGQDEYCLSYIDQCSRP